MSKKMRLIQWSQKLSTRLAGHLSFYEYIRSPRIPIRVLENKEMEQAVVTEFFINGKKIKIYTWGNQGKTVLLVHGWGSRASRFYLLIKALRQENFRVIAFDAPGHGDSEGNTTSIYEYYKIIDYIAAQEGGRLQALIAHSLGVLYSLYALKQSVNVTQFVSVSAVSDMDFTIKSFAKKNNLSPKTQQVIKSKLEHFFKHGSLIWKNFSAASMSEITCKQMLFIHDKDDHDVELRQSEILRDIYQEKSTFHVTESLGHIRILVDGDTINRVVSFMKTC